MLHGDKHLVECRCILLQYKNHPRPPFHKFVVFSIVDDNGEVTETKFVQCPNCAAVHKIIGLCRSEIVQGKEELRGFLTVDDIKVGLPEKLVTILETHNVDLPSWEQARFLIENQVWGKFIILTQETTGDTTHGKYVRILGEKLYKVDTYSSKVF